ncbi:MAG: hypothetical protein K6G49_02130 [Candidatus Saccharibacteria bacterium]|nr:hypothetical protein [Candidatus Saccharibacteria bacterium]
MKSWHLSRMDTLELVNRLNALESRIAILESNNRVLEDVLKRRWDNAVERLLPEIQEKCFIKVYDKEMLVRLLDLAEKAKDEPKGGE